MSIAVLSRLRLGRRNFAPAAPAAAPPVPQKLTPAEAAVRRGGELLTRALPGWYEYISLTELEISNAERCVLGQIGRRDPRGARAVALAREAFIPCFATDTYNAMALALGIDNTTASARLGFAARVGASFDDLTQAWREYIVQLRLL